jgi:hypothetical protein
MSTWLDISQYNPTDICQICQEEYGTQQAIFRTPCGHDFHNNCLSDYCESQNGNILCPVCRADIGESCMSVWAFKEHALGNSAGGPLFNGNQRILNIYNGQNMVPQQGGKRKRRVRSKRKSNKRRSNKRRSNKRRSNKRRHTKKR